MCDDNKKSAPSLIDELVSITAPFTIGNDLAKKAMLIVAVNAGLPNDPTRLPKRIRSNVGLIGDPGLAKTQLLHQIADLVLGSRVESMQSGHGIRYKKSCPVEEREVSYSEIKKGYEITKDQYFSKRIQNRKYC